MGRYRPHFYLSIIVLLIVGGALMVRHMAGAAPQVDNTIYLPQLQRQPPVEFRGLWITRFEWAIGHNPTAVDLDRMVENAANAGFNALLFQVRGTADAYYASQVEPWAVALAGSLGANPGWDPLAHMVSAAHERGLQVHAYLNVYPVWPRNEPPPPLTQPLHLYHKLAQRHGLEDGKLRGLQWNRDYEIPEEFYLRATPASFEADQQLLMVMDDLVNRYELDGIHLDHIRYGGPRNSCDPVSEARIGGPCFTTTPTGYASYEDWQRAQVNGTVYAAYEALFLPNENGQILAPPRLRLSAAVWPFYESGYANFFQDPHAWLAGGYVDAIMPMLYGSIDSTEYYPDPRAKWQELAAGFQAVRAGRDVIPGLNGDFDSFAEIAARIEAARNLGTAGHAIFSYGSLERRGYFDDLANGPYRYPAVPPPVTWHP